MPNFLLSVDSRQSCILDSRYWITNSLSVDLGFRILIVSYSLSRFTDSKAQDSGLHQQRFRNLDYLTWGDKIKRQILEKKWARSCGSLQWTWKPVCHSLTFTFNFCLTEKTFQYHDKCKVFNFWHVF